ncbi:hypothetical protein M0804_004468 [Polistes exclamans]|nr:hypothetical protein M0804_004468 [Polistes exclamans]
MRLVGGGGGGGVGGVEGRGRGIVGWGGLPGEAGGNWSERQTKARTYVLPVGGGGGGGGSTGAGAGGGNGLYYNQGT